MAEAAFVLSSVRTERMQCFYISWTSSCADDTRHVLEIGSAGGTPESPARASTTRVRRDDMPTSSRDALLNLSHLTVDDRDGKIALVLASRPCRRVCSQAIPKLVPDHPVTTILEDLLAADGAAKSPVQVLRSDDDGGCIGNGRLLAFLRSGLDGAQVAVVSPVEICDMSPSPMLLRYSYLRGLPSGAGLAGC